MIKIKSTFLIIITLVVVSTAAFAAKGKSDFYQIKIYHLKSNDQVAMVDDYLQKAYLPALHRMGIKDIGVFKPLANDTASVKLIYILIPFKSIDQWNSISDELTSDKVYTEAAKDFVSAPFDKAPFERMESVLLEAFSNQAHLIVPSSKNPDRIFELRSYESPTLHLAERKMNMFNRGGELPLFSRLKFNPVFYAKVVSGSHMPNLMYMPIFDNVDQRNAQWKVFSSDPKWKEISADPVNENKVSVSHIDSILMHSTSYSDY